MAFHHDDDDAIDTHDERSPRDPRGYLAPPPTPQLMMRDDGTRGDGRRVALLREALARKDSEILTLKTHHVTRERALQEARETIDRLARDRADLEQRLRSHSGMFEAIEAERANLSRSLDVARVERERAQQVLHQADSVVGEWRVAYEQLTHERDDAQRYAQELAHQIAQMQLELRDRDEAFQRAAMEVTRARAELASAKADADARVEAARADAEARVAKVKADADARVEAAENVVTSAREAQAIALRTMQDDHDEELTFERERATALQAVVDSLSQRAEETDDLRARLSQQNEEIARLQVELDARHETAEQIQDLERELDATREALGSYATECAARIEEAERTTAEVRAYRDRYARKLGEAMDQLQATTEQAVKNASDFQHEIARLGGLVGRLTARMVVQGAVSAARFAGRDAPEASDVDESLSMVAEDVPEAVATELWASRDAFVQRTRAMLS